MTLYFGRCTTCTASTSWSPRERPPSSWISTLVARRSLSFQTGLCPKDFASQECKLVTSSDLAKTTVTNWMIQIRKKVENSLKSNQMFNLNWNKQGWGAGAGCFWLLGAGAPWKKTRSRSRLEKKSGAGAGKKLAGSSALREDKKHKEIVL